MQMQEHIGGNFTNRVLCHAGKHGVPKLVETGCTGTGNAICKKASIKRLKSLVEGTCFV